MHKFQRNTLTLMLKILPVVRSLLRTLPNTFLPADQLAPSPRISTDILALLAQNPQQPPVHCVNSTPSFTLQILRSPKFIPNSHNIILFPKLLSPPYPSFTTFPSFTPLSLHLLPYPLIKYLIPLLNASYPLFNVCYPTHIRKF